MRPSDYLDSVTNTFSGDRSHFDALAADPRAIDFFRIWIWSYWYAEFLEPLLAADEARVERELGDRADGLSRLAVHYTGVKRAHGALMFAVIRGAVHEAGAAARQLLELLGLLTHVRRNPAKLPLLAESPRSKEFKDGFVFQRKPRKNIRFDGLAERDELKEIALGLYDQLGQYTVHADSGSWMAIQSMVGTEHQCMFLNRSPDEVIRVLPLLKMAVEITAKGLTGAPSSRDSEEMLDARGTLEAILYDDGELIDEARSAFGLGPISDFN